jgi:hypothetical protein
MLKVMISYNMQPGREQECQNLLVRKVAPGLEQLGFRFSDVWYTIWGKSPHIISGGAVKDLDEVERIFYSDTWLAIRQELESLTSDFQFKVVHPREESKD